MDEKDKPKPDEVEAAVAETLARMEQEQLMLAEMRHSESIRFREALSLQVELLHGAEHAPRLANRHERLYRGEAIARAILALDTDDVMGLHAARLEFDALRETIERNGAFLMHYDLPMMTERVTSDRYVVAESRSAGSEFGGDCQLHMPGDDGALVVHLPDGSRGDVCLTDDIVRHIADGSVSAALLADICSDDKVAHQRYAGNARHKAFEHIVDTNGERAKPIKYIAAEIFSIRGLKTPDKNILLDTHSEAPLGNSVSIWIHTHSKRPGYAATTGWVLKDRNVPVMIDGAPCELITDWWVMVHDMEKIARHRQTTTHPEA